MILSVPNHSFVTPMILPPLEPSHRPLINEHLVSLHGPIGTEKKESSVATIHSSSKVLEQWSGDEHVWRNKRNISRRSENKMGTEKQ